MKAVIHAAALAALIMTTTAAHAAGFIFLELPGVKGDAQLKGFEGQIELMSMNYNFNTGGGRKLDCGDQAFSVAKSIDMASADIIMSAATGKAFPLAKITIVRAGEDNAQRVIQFDLSDVRFASYSTGGEADEPAFMESVDLTYSKLTGTVYNQKPDGSVAPEPFSVSCF